MPPRARSAVRRETPTVGTHKHADVTATASAVGRPRSSRRNEGAANKKPTVGIADANTNANANVTTTNRPRRTICTTKDTPSEPPSSRVARERKPRTTYSPSADEPKRPSRRRAGDVAVESALSSGVADQDLAPDERCRRLEARVRSNVKQLRYLQTFLDAYEAEGWRRASREKLKPSKELAAAKRKMIRAKRHVVDALHEMDELRGRDPPIPYLIEIETQQPDETERGEPTDTGDGNANADQIYCSRCASTVTTEDNDILLCDNEGCFRAFHQQCQVPVVRTETIPVGDEPWFCASCLAIFNALKAINYACDTTHEQITDVFTELPEEEHSLLAEQDGDASTAEGTAEEDTFDDAGDEDDDDDDEDFELNENLRNTDNIEEDEPSDSGEDSDGTSPDDGVLESDVSEDELKHLHNDDVIDLNRRSLRSHAEPRSTQQGSASNRFLGQRVAKTTDNGAVVFGVVVEKDDSGHWRVVYYDDSMAHVDDKAVVTAMALAAEHETQDPKPFHDDDNEGDVDQSLILRGKRKRSRVDYRALNDLMFDGKEDSDAGDADHIESESDDDGASGKLGNGGEDGEDDDADGDYTPSGTSSVMNDDRSPSTTKRGRRQRRAVDYRAMHEGVESF